VARALRATAKPAKGRNQDVAQAAGSVWVEEPLRSTTGEELNLGVGGGDEAQLRERCDSYVRRFATPTTATTAKGSSPSDELLLLIQWKKIVRQQRVQAIWNPNVSRIQMWPPSRCMHEDWSAGREQAGGLRSERGLCSLLSTQKRRAARGLLSLDGVECSAKKRCASLLRAWEPLACCGACHPRPQLAQRIPQPGNNREVAKTALLCCWIGAGSAFLLHWVA
jgi:hypothetical protein